MNETLFFTTLWIDFIYWADIKTDINPQKTIIVIVCLK